MSAAPYRLVLDHTAVIAYTLGVSVGELLGEIADEGARVAVPAMSLVFAAPHVSEKNLALLDVLTAHPAVTVLPVDTSDWSRLAAAARLLGDARWAVAAVPAAMGLADYIVSAAEDAENEVYPGLPVIQV